MLGRRRRYDEVSCYFCEIGDVTFNADDEADKVLFSLPVTKRWLEQVTLALTMIAHASMRGATEFMNDLLGVSISLGTVHNIHQRAARQAIAINDSIDL